MNSIRDALGHKDKKALRLGLLLLSTLSIISASIFVYARIAYQKALSVGNANGLTTGSGSTVPAGLNPGPATILVLAVLALVISLSIFGFLREVSKHSSKTPSAESSPTGPLSARPEPPEIGLPLQLPSLQRDWDEAPKKEEGKE